MLSTAGDARRYPSPSSMSKSTPATTFLRNTVLELRRRWKNATETLGITSIQLVDLVEMADPEFACATPPHSSENSLRDRLEGFDFRFRNFPATKHLPSPYEMLILLHDQGCKLFTEHRIIDIWSPEGEMLGGVCGSIPWQHSNDG